MATPLLKPLQVAGGTFYTFTSAASDISKTFSDDDVRFVFDKFVLLDLPDIKTPTNKYNNIVWESIGVPIGGTESSIPASPGLSSDENHNFALGFQNFVLNKEELILAGQNNLAQEYDSTVKRTVTERLFWRYLASINAMRWQNATGAESNVLDRYVEESTTTTGSQQYNRVVKYMGDIDIVNNISKNGHSYSEIYCHVPTNHGSSPLVMWKALSDSNYTPNRLWSGGQYIFGRDSGTNHPAGLDVQAWYDDDGAESYNSKSTFGNVSNLSTTAQIPSVGSPKTVFLSNMDGAVIDWDPSNYKPLTDNPNIQYLSELNASAASGNFSFNAMLIYYSTYSESDPSDAARNLYGILLLDDFVNSPSSGSYIKRFDVYKPNSITKLNGNSYGLKLNIKFDTSVDNVGIETVINDYNTFSMDMFQDAAYRMKEAGDLFTEHLLEVIEIRQRLNNLEQYFFTQDTIDQLEEKINNLEVILNNSNLALSSPTALLDLINNNAGKIENLTNGNVPLELIYNTDVLDFGDGILLDKSVPNKVKVINKNQDYGTFNICNNDSGFLEYVADNGDDYTDTSNGNVIVLGKFKNYFRNENTTLSSLQDNLIINIKDGVNKWETGMAMRIVFADPIDLNGFDIILKTDYGNKLGNGIFGKTVDIINQSELIGQSPVIEIICKNKSTLEFYVDIIR